MQVQVHIPVFSSKIIVIDIFDITHETKFETPHKTRRSFFE